jgi:2-polyprenyl-3-methyl-5-hydroxy-6-metoxy-1,4-benzoquinol methylase
MDDPDLSPELHRPALQGLRRVNWFSGTTGLLSRLIRQRCEFNRERPLRILDIACGGGDVTLGLARRLPSAVVEGWDISPTAVAVATEQATRLGIQNARFRSVNILQSSTWESIEAGFDVVFCTLFLHHLDRQDAVQLLQAMQRLATQCVVVDDLRRTRLGYALAWAGCRILSRSPIVHVDGPMSVRAALTLDELQALSQEAELQPPEIQTHWPQRFTAIWPI